MHQRRYWGLVVALGTGFCGYGVAPGVGTPLGVTLLGRFALFVGVTLAATEILGVRMARTSDQLVAVADLAVPARASLVALVAIATSVV